MSKIKIIITASFILVIVTIAILYFHSQNYPLQLLCQVAVGLERMAHVSCKGVKIGTVSGKRLEGNQAVVSLRIDKTIQIPINSVFSIELAGISGQKSINIIPSGEKEIITSGSKLNAVDNSKGNINLKDVLNLDKDKIFKIEKIIKE